MLSAKYVGGNTVGTHPVLDTRSSCTANKTLDQLTVIEYVATHSGGFGNWIVMFPGEIESAPRQSTELSARYVPEIEFSPFHIEPLGHV
jgi:hypothetical protein